MKRKIQNLDWHGQRVLITGGSSGLGLELALQLVKKQASVAIVARNLHRLEHAQNLDARIQIIQGDIADQKQAHRIYAEALSQIGDIDVLINNASSLGPMPLRKLIDTDCEDLDLALQTNLVGAFRLTKLVLPSMLLRDQGIVINISSDAAVQDYPTWGAYSVSKSALSHLTRIFQAEASNSKIRFLAIDPGDMDTPLHLAAVPDANRSNLHSPADSARRLLEFIQEGELTPQHRGLR